MRAKPYLFSQTEDVPVPFLWQNSQFPCIHLPLLFPKVCDVEGRNSDGDDDSVKINIKLIFYKAIILP